MRLGSVTRRPVVALAGATIALSIVDGERGDLTRHAAALLAVLILVNQDRWYDLIVLPDEWNSQTASVVVVCSYYLGPVFLLAVPRICHDR